MWLYKTGIGIDICAQLHIIIIPMQSSGPMLDIDWLPCVGRQSCPYSGWGNTSYRNGKSGISYQCNNWCPSVKSSNIHTIKNVCSSILRRINIMNLLPGNEAELRAACTTNDITLACTRRSLDSARHRVRAIVEARGGIIDCYWIVEWIFEVLIIVKIC